MIVLETERLWLRPYETADFEPLHAIFSDPETMRHYPAPFTRGQTRDWMANNRKRYSKDGYGLWAVCLKSTGTLIGDCGLVKQTLDGKTEVEIGYHVARDHWSNGYASEAAAACKSYGFDRLGLPLLISIIAPGNTASIRVAEKIGFALRKEAFIFGKNHLIYAATP